MAGVNVIEVNDISVNFEGLKVIQGLTFSVAKGEKVAITGESGSGKSTLLNVLMGFVKTLSGSTNLFNQELNGQHINSIRKQISWLPQELNLPINSVKELLLHPFQFNLNKKTQPTDNQLIEVIEKLGLTHSILQKQVSEISGGQKQRIIFASCFLLNKPLLLLDEPTSALDTASKSKVLDLIDSKKDLTVIAATHDQDWINRSDKVINLDNAT